MNSKKEEKVRYVRIVQSSGRRRRRSWFKKRWLNLRNYFYLYMLSTVLFCLLVASVTGLIVVTWLWRDSLAEQREYLPSCLKAPIAIVLFFVFLTALFNEF